MVAVSTEAQPFRKPVERHIEHRDHNPHDPAHAAAGAFGEKPGSVVLDPGGLVGIFGIGIEQTTAAKAAQQQPQHPVGAGPAEQGIHHQEQTQPHEGKGNFVHDAEVPHLRVGQGKGRIGLHEIRFCRMVEGRRKAAKKMNQRLG